MKRMMKVSALTACVEAILCLVGCGGGSPEGVAEAEAKAMLKAFGSTSTCKVTRSDINGDKGVVYIDVYENGKRILLRKFLLSKKTGNGRWMNGSQKASDNFTFSFKRNNKQSVASMSLDPAGFTNMCKTTRNRNVVAQFFWNV